jgi:sulfopropanediol 3-dehydrogenase
VGKFLKTVTYQWLSREGSTRVAPVTARICRLEGMLAHEATAELRLRKYS